MFSIENSLKLIFFGYSACAVVLFIILKYLERYFKDTGDRFSDRIARLLGMIVMAPVVVGPVLWFDATVIEPNWIEVKPLTIESSVFDPALENLKIVQITDLHVEKIGYREKQLIKLINDLKPDVILSNGDYVNSKAGWEPAVRVLKQLQARKGIYTILGNTDYYFANEDHILDLLTEAGVHVIRYGNVKLDFEQGYVWLVGLSEIYGNLARQGHAKYVDEAFAGIPIDDPKIVLIHNPDHSETKRIADFKPQVLLAGDTHGGQFGIAWVRKQWSYADRSKYMAGRFAVNGIPLYVNRGIGMKTLYIRFLCRPEITVVKLKNAKAK